MTTSERTQLELAKKDISYMKKEISEIKQSQREGFEALHTQLDAINSKLDRQAGKYITQTFAWKLAGLFISVIMAGIAFANWIKNQ